MCLDYNIKWDSSIGRCINDRFNLASINYMAREDVEVVSEVNESNNKENSPDTFSLYSVGAAFMLKMSVNFLASKLTGQMLGLRTRSWDTLASIRMIEQYFVL